MMRQSPFSTISLALGLGTVAFVAGCAQTGDHARHGAQAVAQACQKRPTMPTLRCAAAPGARFDRRGRLWVAWVYAGHVYVSLSADKGKTFRPPVAVNRIPEKIYARGENRPKLAFGPKDQLYLSWTQKLTQRRFSGHVRFSRSVDGGKTFAEPMTVNDHLEITSHRFDALAVNRRGDIYVAWLDKRDRLAAKRSGKGYKGAALYYALSTDGGKRFRPNKKIMDNTCECCRVAIALDNDRLPAILWRNIYGDNIRDHALVKFKGRNLAGKPVRVSHDHWKVDGCPHHGPAISIAGDGIYHLIWFDNATQRHGLFYAQSSDKAQTFSIPLRFGNYQKAAAHADVLSLGQRVFITWKEFDGKQASLYLLQSGNGGKRWSGPQQLASTTGPADYPFLLNDKHKVYVSWHRQGQDYQLLAVTNRE